MTIRWCSPSENACALRIGGFSHPVQPAALIAWLAKDRRAEINGIELVYHAVVTARRVAEEQGAIALVLDPFDAASERIWTSPPYNFRRSLTPVGGLRRLWMPLFPV